MKESGKIQCAKCGHILSIDELEKGQCNRCKAGIAQDSQSDEAKDDWKYCEKHKKAYREDFGCPKCFADKWRKK
jgi:Zn finger protein HypA/HybF involved in hydrogenase expression